MTLAIRGLIAAPHTPLDSTGELRLTQIERQAAHLRDCGVQAAFICGSTGEGVSLTVEERARVAERWMAVKRDYGLKVIVHVGGNCLTEAEQLAKHALDQRADAVATLAPFYFKPPDVDALIDYCEHVANAAGDLPFYYYHIPVMTGVQLSMREFLQRGRERIPTLAGLKYTDNDLMQLQECLAVAAGELEILHGYDEILLAGLALGIRAATGSTYNFAAPLYQELITAFTAGDLATAAQRQRDSVRLIRLLMRHGFLAASKAMMQLVGIDCGPPRLPLKALSPEAVRCLHDELVSEGLIGYIRRSSAAGGPS